MLMPTMKMAVARPGRSLGFIAALAVIAAGCSSVLNSVESSGTSTAFEPPRSWESAVLFMFYDSTQRESARYGARIEFFDGERQRVVTGSDQFVENLVTTRTPWYRVSMSQSGEFSTTIRITIGDAAGQQMVAEYPITMKRDDFYYVHLGVGSLTRPLPPSNPAIQELRTYPVPVGARHYAGDSLWVSYVTRGRDCFDCPT